MKLTKTELGVARDEIELPYLDMNSIQECIPLTALAYVSDASTGISKLDTGFVTFYLKDVNSNLVTARLFNVADFMLSGVKVSTFRHKPVKVKFVVQEFRGNPSLVIDGVHGIEVYHGDFDYECFIGSIHVDTAELEFIGKNIFGEEWALPAEYQYFSTDTVAKGRVGGFLKIFSMALCTLKGYADLTGLEYSELCTVFYRSMEAYYEVLRSQTVYDNLHALKKYEVFHRIRERYASDDSSYLIVDTVSSVLGYNKPLHFISHLICDAVTSAIKGLDLLYVNNSLPLGAKICTGGGELLKY